MSKLTIEIGAKIDSMQRGLANARANLNGFAKSVSSSMSSGAKAGIAAMGAGVAMILQKSVQLAAAMEQTQVSFKVMTGSADKARAMVDSLVQLANTTPFQSEELLKSAKVLMAFGVAGKDIVPTLKMLGDVSAGTGKDINELSVIFAQIRSAGRLMGQDLLQLVSAGFNPLAIISKQTGKSMLELRKDMEAGLITFDMVEGAFKSATSEGGMFFNMMNEQSQTLNGQLSTLSDAVAKIGVGIGTSMLGPIKLLTEQSIKLAGALDDVNEAAGNMKSGKVKSTSMGVEVAVNYAINLAMLGPGVATAALIGRDNLTGGISASGPSTNEVLAGLEASAARRAETRAAAEAEANKKPAAAGDLWADGDAAWGARIRLQEKMADEEMKMLGEMADAQSQKEAAAAEFGVKGMQGALESRRAELQGNMQLLQDQAGELEKNIGESFRPQALIKSSLANVGGERTITAGRHVAEKSFETLQQTLKVLEESKIELKKIEQTIKDTSGMIFPSS